MQVFIVVSRDDFDVCLLVVVVVVFVVVFVVVVKFGGEELFGGRDAGLVGAWRTNEARSASEGVGACGRTSVEMNAPLTVPGWVIEVASPANDRRPPETGAPTPLCAGSYSILLDVYEYEPRE